MRKSFKVSSFWGKILCQTVYVGRYRNATSIDFCKYCSNYYGTFYKEDGVVLRVGIDFKRAAGDMIMDLIE